jgi:hypothetical protein
LATLLLETVSIFAKASTFFIATWCFADSLKLPFFKMHLTNLVLTYCTGSSSAIMKDHARLGAEERFARWIHYNVLQTDFLIRVPPHFQD